MQPVPQRLTAMEWKLVISWVVLGLHCLRGINAKIVYMNGTEIFNGKLSGRNATTKAPLETWFSVFNPRNISNHSGFMSNTQVHRKSDVEEKVVRKDEEKEKDEALDGAMATRSARQLGLFYAQRFMNGLHLLALLAGIYLMIFVVEPVAVPNRFLAQHYFGVPWIPERRDNPQVYQSVLETIEVSPEHFTDTTVLQRKHSESSQNKSLGDIAFHDRNKIPTPYPFLLTNYSDKPLSLQAVHSKHKLTPTRNNRTSTHHWHHWSSKRLIGHQPKFQRVNGTVRWSSLLPKNGNRTIEREANVNAAGSVKSVKISEILQ